MRSKKTRLHPLLIILAVALVSVLFAVSCGGGATSTAVSDTGAAAAAAAAAAEAAAAEAAAAEAAAAEAAAAEAAAELAAQAGPKRGGTLTVAMITDFVTLDPAYLISEVDIAIGQATYDNLLQIRPDFSIKPELATSWEANEDLTSFTFHLRQGVKFHHGKEFKAEDVLFTYNRLLDPVLDTRARGIFEVIEDIVALDDYTVRFDLVAPNGFFLESLSISQARILPADVDPERLILEEFGTGPFMLEEHLPGERATMVRNPDYWEEGMPYLDELVIVGIREAATRDEALKSGDVDVVWNLQPQSIASIEAHPDTVVLTTPSGTNIGLDMDTSSPPFDSKLLRQAMQAAMDRELINQAALLGLGTIAQDHVIPPTDPRFAQQFAAPDYDPDLAKSLLEQAGYPDGIDITLHTADVHPGMIEMAVAFQESAAPAGIRVAVERHPPDAFWGEVWFHEPLTIILFSAKPTPDRALTQSYHSSSAYNATRYSTDTIDELIERARGETLEQQKVTYAELQRIIIDAVPRLIPVFQPLLFGVRADVRGVAPHPLNMPLFQDGWLDD